MAFEGLTAARIEATPAASGGDDLDELRAELLRLTIAGGLLAAMALVALLVSDQHLERWFAPLALGATVLGAYVVLARSRRIAAWIVSLGGAATALGSVWVYGTGYPVCALGLLVVLAAVLLGPISSVVVAGVGVVGVLATARAGYLDPAVATTGLLLDGGGALLGLAAYWPVKVALSWAWSSYAAAATDKREAQRHRGELGLALKSLNDAYERLARLNAELASAREVADEARRLKAEFAANISHELRTPLNLILGFSEVMVRAPQVYGRGGLSPAHRADIDAIYRNALHLSGLVDDVLDLSQVEAGRLGLRREASDLGRIVAEAADAVRALFVEKELTLEVDLSADLPSLYIDRTRVRQVLINLLANAARFTDLGGARVSARADGRDVIVAVSDTGIGIAPENHARVFEPFLQLDASPRRRHGGSGLGLAICKQFVELHGGAMWIESAPGAGTTFHVSLPTGAAFVGALSPLAARLPSPVPDPDRRRLVVVATEDAAVAALFRRYLDGYEVAVAPSPAAGATAVEETGAHLLVIAAASADDAWRRLEALPPVDVPVVTCAIAGRRDRSGELGVAGHLTKPVARADLLAALRRLDPEPGTVLVVDDDLEALRLLGRMLRSARRGYQVWPAGSGAEALALLRERRPDAVLLDLLMPEIDGYAVLRHLRADPALQRVPVIVVSAYGAESEETRADLVGISRRDGLSMREVMRCLGAAAEVLTSPSADGRAPPLAAAPRA